jgi:uncharacterized protein DUF1839
MTAAIRSVPDVKAYVPHALHREGRSWQETNCYVDLWIELVHFLGLEPRAMMAFTLGIDFEGDQFTFYKPSLSEIEALYGVDTQELALWKSPLEHVAEQVARGRVPLMEADAYYLPDVAATNYHRDHTNKTTIGIQEIDVAGKRMGYFHNAGYYALEGDDFDGVFKVNVLVPYCEFAKLDRVVRRPDGELRQKATELLGYHVARRPAQNPFAAYRARFGADLEALIGQPLERFHLYAFATLRQFGSCFDLAADFLRWLDRGAAAEHCAEIAGAAKTLQFRLARKKLFDFGPIFDSLEKSWQDAMDLLR